MCNQWLGQTFQSYKTGDLYLCRDRPHSTRPFPPQCTRTWNSPTPSNSPRCRGTLRDPNLALSAIRAFAQVPQVSTCFTLRVLSHRCVCPGIYVSCRTCAYTFQGLLATLATRSATLQFMIICFTRIRVDFCKALQCVQHPFRYCRWIYYIFNHTKFDLWKALQWVETGQQAPLTV